MLNWVVSSSVLILIIVVLRFCLRGKISLRLQYGLWLLVAVRLLFPFSVGEAVASVSTWLNLVGDRQAVQEMKDFVETPIQTMQYEEAFDSVSKEYLENGINIENLPEHVLSGTIEYEVQNTMHGGPTPIEIANTIWIVGMILIGVAFLFSNLCFSMKLRNNRVLLDDDISSNFGEKPGSLRVYQTDMVETPCMYGLFYPAIYVTDEVLEKDVNLKHVLEHEFTHYRHMDHIWALIRVVCLVLHWYNPLVWCAAFLSRRDAELACDEATIKRLGEENRVSYGRTLIGLTCEKRPAVLITATTMSGGKRSIRERIKLIAEKPKMAVVTLIVVVLLAVTAIGWTFAGAKPPYESFSEWTKTIDPEKMEYFYVHKGFGDNQIGYKASEEEFATFLNIFQGVPEEDCYRRDKFANGYEDYFLFFICGEDTVNLRCLEDKTIEYVYSEPNFAPEGRTLIIDSPKLWQYIVDLVDENGVPTSELSSGSAPVPGTVASRTVYTTTADLNHDGRPDSIEVIRTTQVDTMGNEGSPDVAKVQVYLGKADGGYETAAAYISNAVGDSHNINGIFVLTEKDGKDYLLYTQCYEGTGGAYYTYSVMCLNGTEIVTVQTDTIEFFTDPYHSGYWKIANREDMIPGFKADLEPWVANGVILASYDAGTETYFSTPSKKIAASTYFDLVWARNSDERLAQFEQEIGKEQWKKELYFASDFVDISDNRDWIEKTSKEDFTKWYNQYDGSKIQRIDYWVRQRPNVSYSGSIPTNYDIVYYRADAGEDAQDAIYKMMECMIQARMIPSEGRTCTYTDYAIPEQKMIQITEHMWFIPFLNGYYAFEGTDLVTMQEIIDSGEPVTEDGLVSFVAQGTSEQYFHILIERDGVYRLQRLDEMK